MSWAGQTAAGESMLLPHPITELPTNARESPLPGVTIVVPCKGRLHHLRESIPCLLRQRTSCEFLIVVVDYGDPDRSYEWVADQRVPQLSAIRVRDGVDEFNLSRARNCGACIASHRLIAFIDADALCDARWLDNAIAPILSGGAVAVIPDWPWPEPGIPPGCGISVVKTSVFHQVRGFDESFRGWGHEDKDFIGRVGQIGRIASFDSNLVELIPHDLESRVTYYSNKQRDLSNFENKVRASQRRGPVNPKGYGSTDLDVFHSIGNAPEVGP
jgi:hypothetical protein